MSSFFADIIDKIASLTTTNSLNNTDDDVESELNEEQKEDLSGSKSHSQIISDVFKEAMSENMLARLTNPSHHNASNLWNQLSHKLDLSYPAKSSLIPIDNKNAFVSIEDIKYAMRHSFCAYQPAIIAIKSQELSLGIKSHCNVLKTCFDLSDSDIIINKCTMNMDNLWKSSTHEPSFYLIVDHNKHKIVLSVRGTSSISDIMTDLNAKCKHCEESNNAFGIKHGYVHEGMMESAKFIKKNVHSTLTELCKIYTKYQVIITGHSLGAGVASLLGLMYNDDEIVRKQNDLKVYSFASPCIVSKEFDAQHIGYSYINSIVLSTDIVTRLSFESVRKWNLRQDLIMNYPQNKIYECLLNNKNESGHDLDSSNSEFLRVLKTLKSPNENEELFPLGRVLWMVPNIVMTDDIENRRKCLMNVGDLKVVEVEKKESKWRDLFDSTIESMSVRMKRIQQNVVANNTDNVLNGFVKDFNRGMNDIKTNIRCKMDNTKNKSKYDGKNYVLCDASSCKHIFQDLVFDFPESLHSHGPERYLWAFDATLIPNVNQL